MDAMDAMDTMDTEASSEADPKRRRVERGELNLTLQSLTGRGCSVSSANIL